MNVSKSSPDQLWTLHKRRFTEIDNDLEAGRITESAPVVKAQLVVDSLIEKEMEHDGTDPAGTVAEALGRIAKRSPAVLNDAP